MKYEDQPHRVTLDFGHGLKLREYTSAERKGMPVIAGALQYFPDAIAAISRVSVKGNEKHNPGEPLRWSRGKSNDQLNCVGRHIDDTGRYRQR